ncbi:MAG: glycosyltransferase family 1 protein [Bacteroidota bacterium]
MRIGIEGQRLFRRKKHGMDMVALELVKNLMKIDYENEYYIFVKKDENPCLESIRNFNIVELESKSYPIWEQKSLPIAAKKAGCEILHCTSNTAPIYTSIPLVVTLHDIIYMESLSLFKKGFSNYQKFGNIYRRMVIPRVAKKCIKLITVSEYSKNRISTFFHIDDSRIKAIYNGVSPHFHPTTNNEIISNIKLSYKLPEKFVLFLGNTDPKKNTIGVLRAISIFNKTSEDKIHLVMLDFEKEALINLIDKVRDKDLINYITLPGYVNYSDLPGIYSMSSIFLYPSLTEGFGIPILEAMACGTPVITSNTSSMPEIGGNAAIFIDPYKPEQIADAIALLLSDPEKCKQLVTLGFEQSKKFTWRNMATEVLDVYTEILSNK